MRSKTKLVMAVFPSTRGFGYAVFEGPRTPVDWGAKEVHGNKNTQSLKKISELLRWFKPDVLVLEDPYGKGSHKSKRVRRLIEAIERLAQKKNIPLRRYSRHLIRQCFALFEAFSKHAIAQEIASELPEFTPRLPPKRRLWMSEDHRMAIFDAVALVFTYYHYDRPRAM